VFIFAGLMYTLNSTSPHFIRCFKPNELKVCDNFDAHFVVRQLRYLGIKEVVNIRQRGYPLRKAHDEFLARYKLINTQFKFDADRDVAEEIAEFICSIDRLSTKGNENSLFKIYFSIIAFSHF
jgi:myosin heavy subunit